MRQAAVAFKLARAGARQGWKRVAVALLSTLASGCATLFGDEKAELAAQNAEQLRVVEEKNQALVAELARVKTDNEKLQARVADMERRVAAARAAAAESKTAALAVGELKEAAAPAPTPAREEKAPAGEAVVAVATPATLPEAPAVVDATPRLVQPTFASTSAEFENEARSDMKMTSVLWGVHLASYKKEDEASAGWRKLQRDNPDELGLLEPRIERITIEGKGEYLRLVGGGFSAQAKARKLCDALSSKGLFCRVASFGGERLSLLDPGGSR